MYKLLIVDDEDIEREGLATLIPWEEYGFTVVDTAWNGIEGYEKIQTLKPDLVITDIKMPVMNGIELIGKTKTDYPEVVFLVLSGYGEYEYTSQAMELGVRHYILKPCKEDKIIKTVEKVKQEMEERKKRQAEQQHYRSQVRRLEPRAKSQMFRSLLLGREQESLDYQLFLEEQGDRKRDVFLLLMRPGQALDYLEQFALTNILTELVGREQVLLYTAMERDLVYLLDRHVWNDIGAIVDKVKKEYEKFLPVSMDTFLSPLGSLKELDQMYRQTGGVNPDTEKERNPAMKALWRAGTLEQILFECKLFLLNKKLEEAGLEEQKAAVEELLGQVFGVEDAGLELSEIWKEGELFRYLAVCVCREKQVKKAEDKDGQRIQRIIYEIYSNLGKPELSLQWLSREVLFMNEDYLGRLFYKHWNQKYSAYVLQIRIEMARRLFQNNPGVRISQVAEETGYPPDGQYFSKTFKKVVGMKPSEYKEELLRNWAG